MSEVNVEEGLFCLEKVCFKNFKTYIKKEKQSQQGANYGSWHDKNKI